MDHFRGLRFSRAARSTGLCHASLFGAPTRNRIWNPPVKSRMLCQLSYKRVVDTKNFELVESHGIEPRVARDGRFTVCWVCRIPHSPKKVR